MLTETRIAFVTEIRIALIVGGLFAGVLVAVQYLLSIASQGPAGAPVNTEGIALLVWSTGLFAAGIVAGTRTGRARGGMLTALSGVFIGTVIEMVVTLVVLMTHRDLLPLVNVGSIGSDPITPSFIAYIAQIYLVLGLYACLPAGIIGGIGSTFGQMFYRPSLVVRESVFPVPLEDGGYGEKENGLLTRPKAGLISILIGMVSGIGVLAVDSGMRIVILLWPNWLLGLMLLLWWTGFLAAGIGADGRGASWQEPLQEEARQL